MIFYCCFSFSFSLCKFNLLSFFKLNFYPNPRKKFSESFSYKSSAVVGIYSWVKMLSGWKDCRWPLNFSSHLSQFLPHWLLLEMIFVLIRFQSAKKEKNSTLQLRIPIDCETHFTLLIKNCPTLEFRCTKTLLEKRKRMELSTLAQIKTKIIA